MDTAAEYANPADEPGGGATPVRLLCLARGLTHVFWGMTAMLGLFLAQATLDVFRGLRLPAYVAGAVFVLGGFWRLHDAGALSPRWPARTRLAVWLSALTIYFAPFLGWWRAMPLQPVFLLNVAGLALAGMGLMLLAALLAGEVFHRLAAPGDRLEALLAAAGVVLLMMAPCAAGLAWAAVITVNDPAPFVQQAARVASAVPGWAASAAILPCALTLMSVWKARRLCYARLCQRRAGDEPARPEDGLGARCGGQR